MAWAKVARVVGAGALGCMLLVGCSDDDDDDLPRDGGTSSDGGRLDAGLDASTGLDASADGGGDAQVLPSPRMSFFVTSDTSATANLGGLAGADARCQRLAAAVGAGSRTWRAFLSTEAGPVSARDRIGSGPWYNAQGVLLANDVASLLARVGDAEVFLDERGHKINGQWAGSPTPNEHDVLTGTSPDGGVAAGKTCADWTSSSDAGVAVVGHTDALGPGGSNEERYRSWFSTHDNRGCNDTAPAGGAGKLYCFAAD